MRGHVARKFSLIQFGSRTTDYHSFPHPNTEIRVTLRLRVALAEGCSLFARTGLRLTQFDSQREGHMSYVKTAMVRVRASMLASGTVKLRWRMLTVSLVLALCSAGPLLAQGPSGQSGNSNIAHLYLAEKDPTNFQVVPGGAWGKLVYRNLGAKV